MARIFAFGAGLVGTYICNELAKQGHEVKAIALNHHEIPLLDIVRDNLQFEIIEKDAFEYLDNNNLEKYDLILNLLPGRIGDSIRGKLITMGLKICDLAFSDISPENYSDQANSTGSIMLHDCGIAPGVSNMVVASEQNQSKPFKSVKIRVGGNPISTDDSWSYCAPFSPTDVIEEYTRPARIRKEGDEIVIPAISDRHIFNAGNHGKMEAFLTDGLRSLLENPKITALSLSEYTVRWPGHIDKFIELRNKGEINEKELVNSWKYQPDKIEFTYMDISIVTNDGRDIIWTFDIPGIDLKSNRLWPSMAVATGIPFIVGCEAILNDKISGIKSPDQYFSDLDEIIKRLRKYGSIITRSE